MNSGTEETKQGTVWQDRIWVMSVAGQAGFLIAFPVLLGMAAGLFLDRQFNTIIVFTVLLSMTGFAGGAFLVYRWVKTTVHKRLEDKKKED